jgi:hypothetical protein
MSWNRIRTVIRGAQAIELEPKHLALLRPIVGEDVQACIVRFEVRPHPYLPKSKGEVICAH